MGTDPADRSGWVLQDMLGMEGQIREVPEARANKRFIARGSDSTECSIDLNGACIPNLSHIRAEGPIK